MALINRLNSTEADFNEKLSTLLAYEATEDKKIESIVADILQSIRQQGDQALLQYTNQLDQMDAKKIQELEVPLSQCHEALEQLKPAQKQALQKAAQRIRTFHEKQQTQDWSYQDEEGSLLGMRITPMDRVGIYVPGGKAAYPSSVLMNAIPAKVAGVSEVIMVTPTPKGEVNHLVLAAAAVAGVDKVYTIGGAQAVGALAYGTETIKQVDKIVGPGNAFVAEAKRRVFGTVGIDMIAGPSEILIICDGKTPADWIAMDLFSQAEHDELAQAILISPDADFLEKVYHSIEKQLPDMPRQEIIKTSLANRGALILVENMDEACEIANFIAPEHLELSVAQPEELIKKIRHAGAIFMGVYSSESLGDYCAGPNHVLPTSRTARFSSPLGVYDFQKKSSLIQVSKQGASILGEIASELAYGEGLQSHARSAEYRFKS